MSSKISAKVPSFVIGAPTILVVEDEQYDVMPLERAFRRLKLSVRLAVVSTGSQALQYLSGEGAYADRQSYPLPVAIFLDMRLPGMNGLEVLERLRRLPENGNLPVIAITAYGNRELPRAYDLGVDFYLLKPVTPERLAEALQAIQLELPGVEERA